MKKSLIREDIDGKYSKINFPSKNQDPEVKHEMKYCCEVSQAVYSTLLQNKTGVPLSSSNEFDENRLYGNTQQPVSIYQDKYSIIDENVRKTGQFDTTESDNNNSYKREGYMNIFWKKIHVADKIKDWFHGQFDEAEFDITATGIDQKSGAEREQLEIFASIWGQWGEQLEYMSNLAGLPSMKSSYIPDAEDDLIMSINAQGYKLLPEKYIEELIQHTFDISDYSDSMKIKWIDDMLEIGIIAAKQYYDTNEHKLKWRYVDPNPTCAGIQYSKHFDYKDAEYAYELVWEKVSSLRGKVHNDSDKEYEILSNSIQQFCGLHNNAPNWDYYVKSGQKTGFFDDFRVPVFHVTWLDSDTERKLIFNTIYGSPKRSVPIKYDEKITGRRLHDMKQKGESKGYIKSIDIPRLYQCSWIVGTEVAYDYGLVNYQSFPPKLPYKFVKITTNPIIKRIIPQIDQINLAWFKFQNALTQMRLNGVSINVQALQQVEMGGNINDPLQLFERFVQTGIMLHNPVEWDGTPGTPQRPFEDVPGGMGNILNEIIAITNDAYMRIERETGISQVMMGMTPAPRTPGKVTEASVQNSMNITKPIISNIMRLKKDMAEFTANSLTPLFKINKDACDSYSKVIGERGIEVMKKSSKYADYGIKLEARATDDDWNILNMLIERSIEAGDLRVDSAAKIFQMKANGYKYKQISAFFQKEIEKNDLRKMQSQQSANEQQQQIMIENAKMKSEIQDKQAQIDAGLQGQMIQGKIAQKDADHKGKAQIKILEKQLGN